MPDHPALVAAAAALVAAVVALLLAVARPTAPAAEDVRPRRRQRDARRASRHPSPQWQGPLQWGERRRPQHQPVPPQMPRAPQ